MATAQASGANSESVGGPEPLGPLPFPLERRDDVARPRLCIVIPAFNEQAVLEQTSRALAAVLDTQPIEWSVLFVNDGSHDGSARLLEQLRRNDSRFGYLLLSRNFGHQAALTAGLDYASADVVVTMDADLQHPPLMLPQLLDAWRMGFDVVHTRKSNTAGLAAWRRVLAWIAYKVVHLAGIPIIPQASDFRLLDASALSALRSLPEGSRLYRGLTVWIGFRQCVIPFDAPERAAGRSQYSLGQLVGLFARSLFDFSDALLYVGIVAGSVSLFLSAFWLLFTIGWIMSTRSDPPRWAATVWSVTMVMQSFVLLFSGLIGIYVARIYAEVRRRPAYIVSVARLGVPAGVPQP